MRSIKKIWFDPVWSKIISFLIITLSTAIFLKIQSLIQGKTFEQVLSQLLQVKVSILTIVIFLFIILIFFLIQKLLLTFNYSENTRKADIEFFNEIRKTILDQDSTIRFLREQDFSGVFSLENTLNIHKFISSCKNSDFKFINPRLEKIKVELEENIGIFIDLINAYTFNRHNGLQSVPKEWEETDEKKYKAIIEKINGAANNICSIYDRLIKEGRKELEI